MADDKKTLLVDLISPDKQPSHSATYIEDRGKDVVWVLAVRGLGAIVLRDSAEREQHGVSIFTDEEIQFDGPLDGPLAPVAQ